MHGYLIHSGAGVESRSPTDIATKGLRLYISRAMFVELANHVKNKTARLYPMALLGAIMAQPSLAERPRADPDAILGQYVEAKRLTNDGTLTLIEGELVATYDHSSWWEKPERILTCALFQRTFTFITPCDLAHLKLRSRPFGSEPYTTQLRREGMSLSHFPLGQKTQSGDKVLPYILMGNEGWHRDENGHGNFAWDVVRANANGETRRPDAAPKDLTGYYVWQSRVELPMDGTVIKVVNDVPDNPVVGDILEGVAAEGNYVAMRIENDLTLYLLHLSHNSIPVRAGQKLKKGTFVGLVGNSGTSVEPHLHLAVTFGPRDWGIPIEFKDLHVSSAANHATQKPFVRPLTGHWCSSARF